MYIIFGIVVLLGIIIGFNVLGIGLDFLENLLPKWMYIPLLSIGLLFLIRWIIRGIFENERELLYDLSDDINDIKKKLGLKIELRTKRQVEESNRRFIWTEVMKGKGLKDLRKTFGFWGFRKNKWWIEDCLKDYPDRKICHKCKTIYGKYADRCPDCLAELESFKEYKKHHPEEKGYVPEYDE